MSRRVSLLRTLLRLTLGLLLAASAFVAGTSAWMESVWGQRVHTVASAPEAPVAIVFGAGLTGELPSRLLADRLDTAVSLYRQGRVQGLLLSGNAQPYHDEPHVMQRYVLQAGVPPTAVALDGEGRSTFDTCLRAHDVSGVRRALLVTQRFHLARALYDAHAVGLEAFGVAADGALAQPIPSPWRELLARPAAVIRVGAHRLGIKWEALR